jgi:tellurite resistance protein
MSEKLLPTFFILIAPPAVGFISYVKLNTAVDNFAKTLYYFALFLVIFLLAQIKIFSKIKFYLSWWAYSFPIASVTIATALIYKQTQLLFYKPIFLSLMSLLTIFIIILIFNTVKAIIKKDICVIEE